MAAKVCLEHLNLIDDGFNLATEAVRRAVKLAVPGDLIVPMLL
jgi:hypothetical protein